MPFLRVIRDQRGYETTYLMHWYREGSRQRSRILYMFRTPSGVRVGREALESEVLRSIEMQHPDIQFDWKTVFDNQQVVEPSLELRRTRKRRRGEQDEDAAAAVPAAAPAAEPPAPPPVAAAPPRPTVPSTIEGATPDEQIAFLTQWYPIVRERVQQRTTDPVRQRALLALTERLNPTAWTDADQITAGLQQAAEALERLSHVFSKRRRRSRRSSGAAQSEPARQPGAAPPTVAEPTQPAGAEPEGPAGGHSRDAPEQSGRPTRSDVTEP